MQDSLRLVSDSIHVVFSTLQTVCAPPAVPATQPLAIGGSFWDLPLVDDTLGALVGAAFAIGLYWVGKAARRRSERKEHAGMMRRTLTILATELDNNCQQMRNFIASPNQFPYDNLRTEIVDACWSDVVRHLVDEADLVDRLARAYRFQRLINRALDLLWVTYATSSAAPGQSVVSPAIVHGQALGLCNDEVPRSQALVAELRTRIASCT
jgi:hypothetical protein